jgi:putative hemolysin
MQYESLSIDVEKVLASKNPALARWVPNFFINYLKKIVHQEDINTFLKDHSHLRNHDFVSACLRELGTANAVRGIEHIPLSGGCIIAANHPLGGLDGLSLMQVVGERRPDIRFFVNDILLHLQNFGELFVGVNKHGKNAKQNLQLMDDVFASDLCVLFFPAGLVSRRQADGSIRDLEWQKSFITKAIRYQKPIIPTFIGGQNSNFFYGLAYWRKRLGIQANIEMLYLVDEMYRQKGKTIQFVFGPPIESSTFSKEKNAAEWAQELKNYIYELGSSSHIQPFKT